MIWRQRSTYCFLAFTCLWLILPGASAQSIDPWMNCPRIPIVYWQAPPASNSAAKTQSRSIKFAQPTAAPPSVSPLAAAGEKKFETPPSVAERTKPGADIKEHGAAVREEGQFYDVYPVVLKEGQKPADDQCTVTITNQSGHVLKVILGTRERTLAALESVRWPVPRQFVWRVEGREPQTEKVGTGDYALQIVIRR